MTPGPVLGSSERDVVVAQLQRILAGDVGTAAGVAVALRGLPDNDSRRRVKDAIYGVAVMRLRLAFMARARGLPATIDDLLDVALSDRTGTIDDDDDDDDDGDIEWPADPIEALSVRRSCPPWLTDQLVTSLGFDNADAFLATSNQPGPITLRTNALRTSRADVLTALADDGIGARENLSTPWAVDVVGHANLTGSRAFRAGLFEVQDASSQLVALACDVSPGDVVVDLCAGRGGKTLALAAALHNQGRIVVNDVDGAALKSLHGRLTRAGVTCVVDASREPLRPHMADVVLVDAPCSSVGVLRRWPDLRYRFDASQLTALVDTQRTLIAQAATLVRPGGRVVYATCSVLDAENHTTHPGGQPGLQVRSSRLLLPHRDGGDGFFIATFDAAR